MPGLFDMLGGGQQQDGGQPAGLGGMSNSLIGLGMGLLQPYNPWAGTNAWSNALQGYQAGAALDQRTRAQQQELAMQKQRLAMAREQMNREPEAIRQLRAMGVDPASQEARDLIYGAKGQPTYGVISNDLLTGPTYGWIDPIRRTATPATAPPAVGATTPFSSPSQTVVPGTTLYWPGNTAPSAPPPDATTGASGAQPAATARNENVLEGLPNDVWRNTVRGIANYEIDPAMLPPNVRPAIMAVAKQYRPDYSAAEFQKRGQPVPAEVASRVGLARAFLDRLDDQKDETGTTVPGLRSRIAAGELTSLQGKAYALAGQGGPGELRRAIDEGAESLLRALTGAGMNKDEASEYSRRYRFSMLDNTDTAIRKLNELENALRYTATEVGKGRGGDDFIKGYRAQFGMPTSTQQQQSAPTAGAGTRTGGAAVPAPADRLRQELIRRGVNPDQ